MKNKAIIIPLALLAYLAIMVYFFGVPAYKAGTITPLKFWGVIGGVSVAVIALHFSIKRREKLRKEREQDMRNSDKNMMAK